MDIIYDYRKDEYHKYRKELFFSSIVLVVVLIIYFLMVRTTNMNITDKVHDIVSIELSPDAKMVVSLISNIIPVLVVIRCLVQDFRIIYIKRLSLMYFLKGIIQLVTIVPGPEYSGNCLNMSSIDMVSSGICADMMFSGHTSIVFLLTQSIWRLILVPLEAILLVLGKQHYISDTLVATIVSSWIEFVI